MHNHGHSEGGPAPAKAKNFSAATKRLLKELKPFRILAISGALLATVGSLLAILAPNRLSDLVNEISRGLIPGVSLDFAVITSTAIFLGSLYLGSAILDYIEAFVMATLSNRFANLLRIQISVKINRLPLSYFDRHEIGDTLSRVTNDVDSIAANLDASLAHLVAAITLLVGTVIMMFVTNPIMAITAVVASLSGFALMSIIMSRSQKYFNARQHYLGLLNGHVEEVYSGLNVVKTYNGQAATEATFAKLNSKLYHSDLRAQFLSGLIHPLMGFVGNFGYVAVCIVGALLALGGQIDFGVIVAFIVYVRLFTSPLSQIGQAMTALQAIAAAAERVFIFLDEPEMKSEDAITEKLEKKDAKGHIEFRHVHFTYDGNAEPTIKDFSATVKPGQKIAIVGPTGAGKTTMVNLLMKFYDLDSGDIIIDGHSTRNLTRENVHSLFTMVLQDTWLFEGTIKENIVYNRKGIPDAKVRAACKAVGLDHFIRTLDGGYNSTLVGTDAVSSGQRQLITIARGMLEDAPFLILDEATSNVDTRTEEMVQAAMDKLMRGRTSFIIAHRLSTIKNADLILMMKDGNIVEQGTHAELIKQGGAYAELYNSQFKL